MKWMEDSRESEEEGICHCGIRERRVDELETWHHSEPSSRQKLIASSSQTSVYWKRLTYKKNMKTYYELYCDRVV